MLVAGAALALAAHRPDGHAEPTHPDVHQQVLHAANQPMNDEAGVWLPPPRQAGTNYFSSFWGGAHAGVGGTLSAISPLLLP